MPLHPNVKVCTHVKVTGIRCGSPALRGEQFCYFHQRMFRGVQVPPQARLHPVALVEDEEAIQASLMEVINALARNTIDLRRAELILKALFIAVKNSARVRFNFHPTEMVREVPDYPTPAASVRANPPAATEITETVQTAEPTERPVQDWAALAKGTEPFDPTQPKPLGRAGIPRERKRAIGKTSSG
jgi:hypothetical protein